MSDKLMTDLMVFDPLTVACSEGEWVAKGRFGGADYIRGGATFEEACRALLSAIAANEPARIKTPDFTKLVAYVVHGVEFAKEKRRFPKDFDHYVYEEAMMAVYGSSYFRWHNKQGFEE